MSDKARKITPPATPNPYVLLGAFLASAFFFFSEVVLWIYWAAEGLIFLSIFFFVMMLLSLGYSIRDIIITRSVWAMAAIVCLIITPLLVANVVGRQLPHKYEFEQKMEQRQQWADIFIRMSTGGKSGEEIEPVLNRMGKYRFYEYPDKGSLGIVDVLVAPSGELHVRFVREGNLVENIIHGKIPLFKPMIHRIIFSSDGTEPELHENLIHLELDEQWHWLIESWL